MELMVVWPETYARCRVTEQCSVEQPVWFCPEQGVFSTQPAQAGTERVLFYWLFSLPVIVNCSHDYVCRIGELTLAYGQARPLSIGADIQIGQFRLLTQPGEMMHAPLAQTSRLFEAAMHHGGEMPEPEDLLPGIGHYTVWQADRSLLHQQDDPLKALAAEYKNVVLWGEQRREPAPPAEQTRHRDAPEGAVFQTLRQKMQHRTVTECILDRPDLMARVCEELDLMNQSDILLDEEPRQDILLLLAPAHLQREKAPPPLPSLMLKEFYKAGLDTLL